MINEAKRLIKDINRNVPDVDVYSGVMDSAKELKTAIHNQQQQQDQQLNRVDMGELLDDVEVNLNENTSRIVEAIAAASNELSRELNYLTNQIRNLR